MRRPWELGFTFCTKAPPTHTSRDFRRLVISALATDCSQIHLIWLAPSLSHSSSAEDREDKGVENA